MSMDQSKDRQVAFLVIVVILLVSGAVWMKNNVFSSIMVQNITDILTAQAQTVLDVFQHRCETY